MNTKPESTVQKAVLTTKEAAAYLSISLPTLHRLLRAGELPHLRLGRVIRFRVEDLDAFLESRVTTEWTDFVSAKKKAATAAETPPPQALRKGKSPQSRIIGHKG